jgi:hypothetical protein
MGLCASLLPCWRNSSGEHERLIVNVLRDPTDGHASNFQSMCPPAPRLRDVRFVVPDGTDSSDVDVDPNELQEFLNEEGEEEKGEA